MAAHLGRIPVDVEVRDEDVDEGDEETREGDDERVEQLPAHLKQWENYVFLGRSF